VLGETTDDEEPLFEVKNKDGQTIFAVYNNGVRVYVDTADTKGPKGGFAVGGFSSSKGSTEYLNISPGSVRIYVDTTGTKGPKGGFAVGGYSSSKGAGQEYMRITGDSVRIYIDTTNAKGPKGGFAVGGYSSSKGPGREFLRVTDDSTRVYVNTDDSKGPKGGFAVGGYSPGKSDNATGFMHMTKKNYFIGHESGKSITTGQYNSFLGYQSGYYSTSGSNNIFLGYQSGFKNIEGFDNTYVGYQSGFSNEYGYANTFLGYQSGYKCYYGEGNTFLGHMSGYENGDGGNNVFIGYLSGYENNTGNGNIFIGYRTGFSNGNGHYNTYLGHKSGEDNLSGGNNVFVGRYCGNNNQNGDENTFIGSYAGFTNINGNGNLFIGFRSGNNNTGNSNIFIGNRAGLDEGGSNKLIIENTDAVPENVLIYGEFDNDILTFNANVGIGTTSPSEKLDVRGKIRNTQGTTHDVWIQGGSATTGSERNLAILGTDNDSGDKLYINYNGEYTGGTIINGNVGIGTTTPTQKLEVAGDGKFTGGDIQIWSGTKAVCFRQDGSHSYISNRQNFVGNGSESNGELILNGEGGVILKYGVGTSSGIDGLILTELGRVGIGTTTPSTPLHVITENQTIGVVRGESTYSGTTANYGAAFEAKYGTQGIGCFAAGSSVDFYAGGPGINFYPFTGSHEVILSEELPKDILPGMIVSLTGYVEKRYKDDGSVSLSSTMPEITIATEDQDKAVFGVFVSEDQHTKDHWLQREVRVGTVNALGEGRVWVCNSNGDIEAGDYLTTSSVPGYGQKQEDDLLHNYTLGKATETIDWNSITKVVTINGKTYKVYLIGVVYTSG
jgi:hypothetical protein